MAGALILLLASFVHAWYAGNASAGPGQAAPGFRSHGHIALLLTIVLMLVGFGLLWAQTGFGAAVLGAVVYFFVLPIVALPILRAMKFVPESSASDFS